MSEAVAFVLGALFGLACVWVGSKLPEIVLSRLDPVLKDQPVPESIAVDAEAPPKDTERRNVTILSGDAQERLYNFIREQAPRASSRDLQRAVEDVQRQLAGLDWGD